MRKREESERKFSIAVAIILALLAIMTYIVVFIAAYLFKIS